MKYMIANGNDYIQLPRPFNNVDVSKNEYISVGNLTSATRFTYQDAIDFVQQCLNSDIKWSLRKLPKDGSGKNFVVTTGTNYVTNTTQSKITPNFAKAKWFRSAADAETYIKKKKDLFDNPVIVDEEGNLVEQTARKTFTDEQLAIIGKLDKPKTVRIAIPKTVREMVYENGHGICAICGKPVDINDFTIDHIVPISRGGSNNPDNLQIACEDCNKLKSNRMNSEFATGLTNILSRSLQDKPNDELADMLVRAIVRGKISTMYQSIGL